MIRERRPTQAARLGFLRPILEVVAAACVAGCSSFGASGPSGRAVLAATDKPLADAAISVVPLTEGVARHLIAADRTTRFSELFIETDVMGSLIGRGDVLEITLWEAPPLRYDLRWHDVRCARHLKQPLPTWPGG
jgi:polysaccharide export outer membrane protein